MFVTWNFISSLNCIIRIMWTIWIIWLRTIGFFFNLRHKKSRVLTDTYELFLQLIESGLPHCDVHNLYTVLKCVKEANTSNWRIRTQIRVLKKTNHHSCVIEEAYLVTVSYFSCLTLSIWDIKKNTFTAKRLLT